MYYIGFDIGGSNVKAALVKNKKIVESRVEKLPKSFKGLLDLVAKIINNFAKKAKIGGVGFAVPGALDPEREKVLNSPNIKYLNGKPFKKSVEKKIGYPVRIEHDVHCFLLAESAVGLAKKSRNVFYITLGTGLGGAWALNGKIYYGAHGSAGEIGHVIISSKKLSLEDLASNKFFKRFYGKSSEELSYLARKGNKRAKKAFREMGENLGVGLAGLVNILDPEIIILSGGIAEVNSRFFLPFAKKTMEKYIISPLAKKEIKVIISKLHFAGALGAALLFFKK